MIQYSDDIKGVRYLKVPFTVGGMMSLDCYTQTDRKTFHEIKGFNYANQGSLETGGR